MTVAVPAVAEATGSPAARGRGQGKCRITLAQALAPRVEWCGGEQALALLPQALVDQKLEVPRLPTDPGAGTGCLGFPRWACTCLCEVVVGRSTFRCLSP